MAEIVAKLSMTGEPGWMAVNLADQTQAQSLIEEILSIVDGSYAQDEYDPDDNSFVQVRIERKPDGYLANLPEFNGW